MMFYLQEILALILLSSKKDQTRLKILFSYDLKSLIRAFRFWNVGDEKRFGILCESSS